MYNNLFSIGPLTVHGYGLTIAVGILCALLVAQRRATKKGLNENVLYGMAFAGLAAGFASAKLLYCIVEFRALLQDPWMVLSSGGFVLYGGIIGGALSMVAYCRWKKADVLKYFDLAAPSVALAQGFGRIGCFLAGCCYGRETDSFLGVMFQHSDIAPNGVKLLPTQLFSSAGDFIIAAVLLFYAKKTPKDGRVLALYMILYSMGRFAVEFLRNDPRGSVGALSTSQFIALFLLAGGVVLFFQENIKSIWKKTTPENSAGE